MRTIHLLALALLLAAAVPAAGEASASEVSAEGLVRVTAAGTMLEADLTRAGFNLEARHVELTLVDNWSDVYKTPPGDEFIATERQHDTETIPMRDVELESTDADADGVLLILDGATDHRMVSSVQGRVEVAGATDQILEEQHWANGNGMGISPGHNYAYRAGDGLALAVDGNISHNVRGDFTIYLWGTNFTVLHDDGAQTHRTGFYETTSPRDGGTGVLVRQHYAHAILDVRDGTLTASGSSGGLYGDSFDLDLDGVALLSGAEGSLSSAEGTHDLSGGVTVEDGAYSLTRSDAGIALAVHEHPASVRGGMDTTVPSASPLLSAGAVVGIAAVLVVAVGTIYARPAVVAGIGEMRYRRVAAVRPPRMTWRELRAEGHRRMAYGVQARGGHRRALWHMGRALRIEPGHPQTLVSRGILLRQLGRYKAAVENHRRAHEWLDALDEEGSDTGSNAFEAARACALSERCDDALHWLGIAVRSDRDLCADVASEPDFACIRDTTEYLSLMRGWKPRRDGAQDDLLAP